jgi:hypothetical protein
VPTGFTLPEIDIIFDAAKTAAPDPDGDQADHIPPVPKVPVTRLGDVWQLGRHRLVCGDAPDASAYDALLGDEEVGPIFTDPPEL